VQYGQPSLPGELPEIKNVGGVERLLAGVRTAVMTSTGRAVGFVLDANSPLAGRWQALRERLEQVGVSAPHAPPQGGFVGESTVYRSRVGAWLMPDNTQDGSLEDFLRTLVQTEDSLIDHAVAATRVAAELGASFPPQSRRKAQMHAWLAWQEQPGLPYGSAIKARYFGHDSEAACAFVAWFKKLFSVT
jgi:hypothetical protein